MGYTFSETNIRDNQVVFIYEESAPQSVRKIAGRVREDIEKVFGAKPIGIEYENFADTAEFYSYPIFFGALGHSAILDKLAQAGAVDLFDLAGENELYSVSIVDNLRFEGFSFDSAIIIAGADIAGTCYGLFTLSGMLGVSPFTDISSVNPPKLSELTLAASDSCVGAAPVSAKRGFAFDAKGLGDKDLTKISELLLRLKGNCLYVDADVETDAQQYGITICDDEADVFDAGRFIANGYDLGLYMAKQYCETNPVAYTKEFVSANFGSFTDDMRQETEDIINGYTKIAEDVGEDDPGESLLSKYTLDEAAKIIEETDVMLEQVDNVAKRLKGNAAKSFDKLVTLPVYARLIPLKMWVLTGMNHTYASMGSTYANTLAEKIKTCIKKDRKLSKKLERASVWKKNPVVHMIEPCDYPAIIVSNPATGEYVLSIDDGADISMDAAMTPPVCGGFVEICSASSEKVAYSITTDDEYIDIIEAGNSVKCGAMRRVFLLVDRGKLPQNDGHVTGTVTVTTNDNKITIKVPVYEPKE